MIIPLAWFWKLIAIRIQHPTGHHQVVIEVTILTEDDFIVYIHRLYQIMKVATLARYPEL